MKSPLTQFTDFVGFSNTSDTEPVPPTDATFQREALGPKEVFLTWETVDRPQKKAFSPKALRTLIVLGIALGALLIVMGEVFLLIAILSIIFVSYVLYTVPPQSVTHEVSSHGVSFAGQFYYWNDLTKFFFMEDSGHIILAIDTKEALPGRLFLTILPKDQPKLKEIALRYLPFLENAPEAFVDRAYNRISSKFDLTEK